MPVAGNGGRGAVSGRRHDSVIRVGGGALVGVCCGRVEGEARRHSAADNIIKNEKEWRQNEQRSTST